MQPTLANRNNNPGNLRDPATGSFRKFNTPQEGYAALLNDLETKKSGASTTGINGSHTLADFAKVYAPEGDNNDPAQYTANLANKMGVAPDARVSDLDVGKWADAIANAEGYSTAGLGAFGTQTPAPQHQENQAALAGAQPGVLNQEKPKKDLLQKTGDVVNAIFPGKQVGQAIGTLGGLALEKVKGLFGGKDNSAEYDLSAPTPLQVAGDVAQGALMVGTGLPEAGASTVAGSKALGAAKSILPVAKTALGRIGQAGVIGAGTGLTQALKEGKTNVKDIAKDTAIAGGVGLATGGIGEAISKIAQSFPKRVTRSFIPGINDDAAQHLVDKGLGSPEKMLQESDDSIKALGTKLDSVLRDPKYAKVKVNGKQVLKEVASNFSDAGLKPKDVALKLKSLVPLKSKLVDKLSKGTITLKELHTLNSALGKNTFKTVFDDPAVKAGKEIGAEIYGTLSDIIKTKAPESASLFDDLAKEIPLRKALTQVIRRGDKSRLFTLRDLVAISTGSAAGSHFGLPGAIIGGVGSFVGEKALTSPTVNLKAAGALSKLGKPGVQAAARASRVPLTKGILGAKKFVTGD